MDRPIVPRRTDAEVQAEAKLHWHGDDEKVPTTSIKSLTYKGIMLSSRYSKAGEYEEMMRIIDSLKPITPRIISQIWCDSKAQACYSITLNDDVTREEAEFLYSDLSEGLERSHIGHNGITIEGPNSQGLDLDPDWYEPDLQL